MRQIWFQFAFAILTLWCLLPKAANGFSVNHQRSILRTRLSEKRLSSPFPHSIAQRMCHPPRVQRGQDLASTTSKSTLFSDDAKQRYRAKPWLNILRKAWFSFALLSWFIFPWRAAAASTTTISSTLQTYIPSRRDSVRIALATFFITFLLRWIRLRRRQTLDATSEWSRYAN